MNVILLFLFTLCDFVIWIFLMVSNIPFPSLLHCTPFQLLCLHSSLNVAETLNESMSLANKHCLHLSIFLCSKQSITHCQSPFLMFRLMTLFQSFKLRSHNLFHSISSYPFTLNLLPHNPHSNFPQIAMVSEKGKMRVVRIELTTLGL